MFRICNLLRDHRWTKFQLHHESRWLHAYQMEPLRASLLISMSRRVTLRKCAKDLEAMTSVAGDSDDAKGQLEDLQVATIYSLVEAIQAKAGAVTFNVPILYLTNNQANKFPFHDLSKVLQSLDISPEPKFIINLLDSRPFTRNRREGMSDISNVSPHFGFEDPSATIFDANQVEYMSTITELSRFMQDKLLPLAIRTNALVLVGSTGGTICALSTEFCRVVARLQQYSGGKRLPFTVLCVTSSFHHTRRMDVPGTEFSL